MESLVIQDQAGSNLNLLEDAGYYFSPNVNSDHIMELHNFKARPDDVLIVTYPKSGTHWTWEITSMLVNGSSQLMDGCIAHTEYLPMSVLDNMPSPRVLCTHLPFCRIPIDFLRKRSKIIVAVRNPRDVAVSYYNFISNLNVWEYDGSWDGFFNLFLDGKVPYNSWFEHTDTWLKVARGGKYNLHVLLYEDLHKSFRKEVSVLANFLDVSLKSQLLDAVERETSFTNMKFCKNDFTIPMSRNGKSPIYRKGQVGDWKNMFSTEQVEQLEEEMVFWGLSKGPRSVTDSSNDNNNTVTAFTVSSNANNNNNNNNAVTG